MKAHDDNAIAILAKQQTEINNIICPGNESI